MPELCSFQSKNQLFDPICLSMSGTIYCNLRRESMGKPLSLVVKERLKPRSVSEETVDHTAQKPISTEAQKHYRHACMSFPTLFTSKTMIMICFPFLALCKDTEILHGCCMPQQRNTKKKRNTANTMHWSSTTASSKHCIFRNFLHPNSKTVVLAVVLHLMRNNIESVFAWFCACPKHKQSACDSATPL